MANSEAPCPDDRPPAQPPTWHDGRPTMRPSPAVLWCSLALACSGAAPPAATRADAVLSSTPDTATSSVFLLDLRFDNGSAAICSAVLISPRVLLTAAHCVEPALHPSATTVSVRGTNKPDDKGLQSTDFIAVTTVQQHPQWNASGGTSSYDLACLLLASAPTATPAVLLRALPAGGLVGKSVRVVGYGRTTAANDDSGTRRSGTAAVTSVTADVLELGVEATSGVCNGDSGGPSLLIGSDSIERVAGIHSSTSSSSCGAGTDMRVDARLDFIDAFIAANNPPLCTKDGRCATGCAQSDPDCICLADGVCNASCAEVDPDCPCGSDGICTLGCGATDPDCANCGSNSVCAQARCPIADPDCLLDGAVCQGPDECDGRQCLADSRGFKFCSRTCGTTADCQLGMFCNDGLCGPKVLNEPAKGGCASTTGASPLLLLLHLIRRRRSPCSTRAYTPAP